MMKLALGFLAILGGFIGWITALDAPHLKSARYAGRFGFTLAVICIVALVALPAAANESCRLVGEPKPTGCGYFTPTGRYLCDAERCVEMVAFPPECLQTRIACADDGVFGEGRVK